MDAARALLGVAPPSSSKPEASPEEDNSNTSSKTSRLSTTASSVSFTSFTFGASSANTTSILTPCLSAPASRFNPRTGTFEPIAKQKQPHQKSLSPLAAAAEAATTGSSLRTTPVHAALDALAALASCEHEQQPIIHHATSSSIVVSSASASEDEDNTTNYTNYDNDKYDSMPPPPPRTMILTRGRRRAVSNPEGMEKWAPLPSSRRHFVLPACILEEELAEASAAMEAHNERLLEAAAAHEEEEECLSSSPSSSSLAPISGLMSEEEQANLTPEELLRKARSRLLEDLSEGMLNGEKGVLTLPHSLNKYKEVRLLVYQTVWRELEKYLDGMYYISFTHSKPIRCIIRSFHRMTHHITLQTGLQQEWTHWDIYSCRTIGHYCSLSKQANTTGLEQKDSLQLSQESGRSPDARQGSVCQARAAARYY